jgi:4-amino-4-deoxy-L-arabinose transferase-like glycosyltransferase
VIGAAVARLARSRARSARGDRRLLVVLGLLVVGAGIGFRDPWGVDEERFIGVALELLQRGDWLILFRAGEPYADKPPLFMWVLAVAYRLTGSIGLSIRLPGLVSAIVAVVLVHDLGTRLWHRRAGLAAGLLFLGVYQTVSVLRGGQIDSLLILWTTLGLYGLVRHLVDGPHWGWYTAAGIAMGLGVISKGVGFLPLLVLIPFALGRRRGFRHLSPISLRDWRWLLVLLGLLGAVGLWLLPLANRVAGSADPALHAYLRNILFRQTAERFVDAWQHREPHWYFVVEVIPLFWLPVVLFLPWLVPGWRNRLRRADGRYLLLLGWVLLVVLFFSLSTGKRKVYVFPALPALALAAAPLMPWLGRRLAAVTRRPGILRVATVTYFAGLIAWGVAEPLLLDRRYSRRAPMAAVARELGPEREVALVGWREGHWLFAQNPLVHFGYRGGPDQVHQAQAWLRAGPDRWLLAPARLLRACFDLGRSIRVGREKGSDLVLVDAGMDTGRCTPRRPEPLYRFRWAPGLADRLARSPSPPRGGTEPLRRRPDRFRPRPAAGHAKLIHAGEIVSPPDAADRQSRVIREEISGA